MSDNNETHINTEYIGKPPSWLVRQGTVVITIVFILFLFLSMMVSYNDVIHSQITITTTIPPSYITANRNGIVEEVNTKSGELVQKDEILAVLRNTASTKETIQVLSKIEESYDSITSLKSLSNEYPPEYNLGDMQQEYNEFIIAYQRYINFNSLKREAKKGEGLKEQAVNQNFALNNQKRKLVLARRRAKLSNVQYDKQKLLYEKGVISRSELDIFEGSWLEAQQNVQNSYQQLSLYTIESNKLESAFVDSDLNTVELENNYTSELWASRQGLISAINGWKNDYLFISPIRGNVSIFDVWQKYQNVEQGDFVFSVVPLDGGKLLGKLKVPLGNSGKIKQGQTVIIKLENYPYTEWGTIQGKITHISDVPKKGIDAYYSIYVELENLRTSFDKEIEFKQEMSGSAEIILAESSLLSRIFNQFRSIWE